MLYRELRDITQIEQILKDNSVVILYENKPKRGHWICIIRYIKNNVPTLEFFDSYGFFPDDEKNLISKEFLRNSNQKYNKIAELLLEASNRYNVEFNDYKLQKKSSDIATCGRHVISRIILKNLDIDEYHEFLSSFKSYGLKPDDVVTIISLFNF